MSVPTKDGAWIRLDTHVIVHCSQCGDVETIRHRLNSREEDEVIHRHVDLHGGRDRGDLS